MLSRAFHRQCLLCSKSITNKYTDLLQGRKSALLRLVFPYSTTTDINLQQEHVIRSRRHLIKHIRRCSSLAETEEKQTAEHDTDGCEKDNQTAEHDTDGCEKDNQTAEHDTDGCEKDNQTAEHDTDGCEKHQTAEHDTDGCEKHQTAEHDTDGCEKHQTAEHDTDGCEKDNVKTPETKFRTLILDIPNADVIPGTLYELSDDIVDVNLHHIVSDSNTSHAFLVFGSEGIAEQNYNMLREHGFCVRFPDAINRTVWIVFNKQTIKENYIKNLTSDIVEVKLEKFAPKQWLARVIYPSVEVALAKFKQLKLKRQKVVRNVRHERVIKKVDVSRSLWLGYFKLEVTEDQIKSMSTDPTKVIMKQTDNGLGYAYIEFESECLATKNYYLLRDKEVSVELARDKRLCDKSADRHCTVYLQLGLKKLQDQDILELSDDIMEAHIIQKNNGARHVYLKFETALLTERNFSMLKTMGHDVTLLGQMTGRIGKAQSSTLCLDFGDATISKESLMELSADIVDVHIIYRNNRSYALVKFPSVEVAAKNSELLKSRVCNTGYITDTHTHESEAKVLVLRNLNEGTTNDDVMNLSEDIVDVHMRKPYKIIQNAILTFASEELADKNWHLLRERGYDVRYKGEKGRMKIEEAAKRTLMLRELDIETTGENVKDLVDCDVKVSMECYKNTRSALIEFPSEELTEVYLKKLTDLGHIVDLYENAKDQDARTLYIPFKNHLLSKKDMEFSEEILRVYIQRGSKHNPMYALVLFPSVESAEEHLKLFLSLNLKASFKTRK